MKFVSWNVNGLRACVGKGDFDKAFSELDADFFCLQETKMQQGQLDLEYLGYESYWNSAEKKGYSGTAVYTRHHPLGVTYGIPEDGEEEFDETFAEIDIQDTLKKIAELTSDRSRGAVRGATADVVYVYEHLDHKDELKKAADLYRNGQSDAGYTALKNALGEIDFELR